jgi:hypothetical protein
LLTIDVAVLLMIIVASKLSRRSRLDEKFAIVLVLGIVIAPTALGTSNFSIVGQLAQGISTNSSR